MNKLLPKELIFVFGDNEYKALNKKGTYTVKRKLTNSLECSEFSVILGEDVLDTVEQEIKLQKGDYLHFEYHLDVKLLG